MTRSAQRSISGALAALLIVMSLATAPPPAQAALRFCNRTPNDAQVVEGHKNGSEGLTVKGTLNVRRGTCSVIVPGKLKMRRYYVHVVVNGDAYGSHENRLCVYPILHFTITNEDKPGFACRGTIFPEGRIKIPGFVNAKMELADFVALDTNGGPDATLTQRRDYSFNYQLH